LSENNLHGAFATVGASGKVAADRSDDGGPVDSTTENSAGIKSRPEASDLAGKHRKRQFGRFEFRMPHLLPLVAVPPVVCSVFEQ